MTALTPSTCRRLQKLRQIPGVWEGDRRTLTPSMAASIEPEADYGGECILWVDGNEAVVRAMDVVPSGTGPEAVVRTLLRAMELPHNAQPGRPQKIVVRNREIQFFLRGVLQDLNITVDYVQELPLIDEIFRGLQDIAGNRQPKLPPDYAEPLTKVAHQLWNDAPWDVLDEEKILAIELNHGDIQTLYVSILGMLRMEYGILLYRSLDSLKQFRQQVLKAGSSPNRMEQAFLLQDCFFVTFDQIDEAADPTGGDRSTDDLTELLFKDTGVRPEFGNLHPLEGMRPTIYDDEAPTVLLALTALHRFLHQHQSKLEEGHFPEISSRYRIPDPKNASTKLAVKVSTLPELADELFELSARSDLEHLDNFDDLEDLDNFDDLYEVFQTQAPLLRNDLIPGDAFFSIGVMSWEILTHFRQGTKVYQGAGVDFPMTADGFPVILIQTSRPKALELIAELQTCGGLKAICFNPGKDPLINQGYDLGLLQTSNGNLHLFGEFAEDDPTHIEARKRWDHRCSQTKGYCGLVIAKGLKGASRGKPQMKDMMALFEARSLSARELGIGPLELLPQWE